MPSIGETLRDARMRQRLDIADVEARTKIRAKYLRALENEEFGMLPGPTFVKTFLRTYAETLGLDPHVLVEEYRLAHEGEEEAELQPLGPPSVTGRDRRYGPSRIGPGTVALLALVGVLGVLLAIGLMSDDDGGEDSAARTETQTETAPVAEPPPEETVPERVVLRITPLTPTYVCVDRGAGTEVIFQDTIDSAETFRGRRLRVNLGKTDIEMTANGEPVEVAPGPNPVGYAFTPGGMREVPLGERPCA